jgi:hypothetical protein
MDILQQPGILVAQALRDAKALFDEGILSESEFKDVKAELLRLRSSDLPEIRARGAVLRCAVLDVSQTYPVESVRTFLLCRARASRGSAFGRLPDAVCQSIAATSGVFLPAATFGGSKPGMTFKLGGRGLGYYPNFDFAALSTPAREPRRRRRRFMPDPQYIIERDARIARNQAFLKIIGIRAP